MKYCNVKSRKSILKMMVYKAFKETILNLLHVAGFEMLHDILPFSKYFPNVEQRLSEFVTSR